MAFHERICSFVIKMHELTKIMYRSIIQSWNVIIVNGHSVILHGLEVL